MQRHMLQAGFEELYHNILRPVGLPGSTATTQLTSEEAAAMLASSLGEAARIAWCSVTDATVQRRCREFAELHAFVASMPAAMAISMDNINPTLLLAYLVGATFELFNAYMYVYIYMYIRTNVHVYMCCCFPKIILRNPDIITGCLNKHRGTQLLDGSVVAAPGSLARSPTCRHASLNAVATEAGRPTAALATPASATTFSSSCEATIGSCCMPASKPPAQCPCCSVKCGTPCSTLQRRCHSNRLALWSALWTVVTPA